jgi:hypothetical protein
MKHSLKKYIYETSRFLNRKKWFLFQVHIRVKVGLSLNDKGKIGRKNDKL